MERFIYNSYGVGYRTYSTSPFLVFLSSFFAGGAFPPFLFLSSTTSSSLLNSLRVYETNLSKRGQVPSFVIISREVSYAIYVELY